MKNTLKKVARIIAGTVIFFSLGIGVSDDVSLTANFVAMVTFFVVGGLWLLLSRRRPRRHTYEQLNRR